MPPTRADRQLHRHHRLAWRSRALAVLLAHRPELARSWGPDGPLQYVHVADDDWTDTPWAFPGAHRVWLSWPATKPFDVKRWARHWNQAHGFPTQGGLPWTWTWHPDRGVLEGHPFDLHGDTEGRLWLPDRDLAAAPRRPWQALAEDGTVVAWDMDRHPHMLAAGSTGSGKSKGIHCTICQLVAAQVVQAVVVLDWKRADFAPLKGRAWNPATCQGVTVAMPDLTPAGTLADLETMAATAEAVHAELGRRMLAAEDLAEGADPWADRLVLFPIDEALVTLTREPNPPKELKGEPWDSIRRRNTQRARIELVLSQVLLMGRRLRIHAIIGASSPRKEIIPGEAMAAVQHRLWFGPFLDVSEPVITFGRDAPASPPGWPGYGVWRVLRPDADPLDPYLYVKGYWLPTSTLTAWLDATVLAAADYDPDSDDSPWREAA